MNMLARSPKNVVENVLVVAELQLLKVKSQGVHLFRQTRFFQYDTVASLEVTTMRLTVFTIIIPHTMEFVVSVLQNMYASSLNDNGFCL